MGKDKLYLTLLIIAGLVGGTLVGALLHGDYDEREQQKLIHDAAVRLAAHQAALAEKAQWERIAAQTHSQPATTQPAGLIADPAELARLKNLASTLPSEAWTLHPRSAALKYLYFVGRKIFMNALFMLIIPLVLSSVIAGVTSVGNFAELGRIGAKTFAYYFLTMFLAVALGLVLVNAFKPGARMAHDLGGQAAMRAEAEAAYADSGKAEQVSKNNPGGLGGALLNIVSQVIPSNIMESMAGNQPLPIIFFALLFGIMLTTLGDAARVVMQFFDILFQVIMKMVHLVIWLAPVGVFCLLAWTVARIGIAVFTHAIGGYMAVVIAGLAIHGLVVLPLMLWILGRTNPYVFMHRMKQALLTAFGTDSSSATLPVTMECATEFGGVSRKAAGFVLPLGATINMDGTALYEAVAVAFLAQAFGVHVGPVGMVIIALTATLAAVGAAGIPEAGLVTMAIVVTAVNQNVLASTPGAETIPLAGVALIIGVDRILDMCRTTVNVWGDAVVAKIITRSEPDATPPAAAV
ncbi:MAG: C4-dicarboxylate transport protein [Phycisphaerae bacterium]|nr:C4-dicarboxylate transport protein [Phycisphaerae bacterium]